MDKIRLDPTFTEFLLRIESGKKETDHADVIEIPSSILIYNFDIL